MQFGVLAAAISAGATSLTLVAGQGARFDPIASGTTVNLMIVDYNTSQNANYNRFEEVQATLLSGDTFTIVRGQNGTTGIAFPIGSAPADVPSLVKVFVCDSYPNLRRFVQGQGAIIQATAPTLTSESPEVLVLTPAAPITLTLPTTGVWAGRRFKICNLGASPNAITVNASGGGVVGIVPAGSNLELVAYKDTPTLGTDWGNPNSTVRFAAGDSGSVLTSTSSQAVGATLPVPANTLFANGKAYRATFFLDTNQAAAQFTVQFRFNAASFYAFQANAGSNGSIHAQAMIVRLSATTCIICVLKTSASLAGNATETVQSVLTVTNWTSAINFDVNISSWTSGTIRSLITGEVVG